MRRATSRRTTPRLGATYVQGTNIDIVAGPLLKTVPSDDDWQALAGNAINYQRSRLVPQHTQLDLLEEEPRELRPVRLIAPALVANSGVEDRINRLLVDASLPRPRLPLPSRSSCRQIDSSIQAKSSGCSRRFPPTTSVPIRLDTHDDRAAAACR